MTKITDIPDVMGEAHNPAYEQMVQDAMLKALEDATTLPNGQHLIRNDEVIRAITNMLAMVGGMSLKKNTPAAVREFTEKRAKELRILMIAIVSNEEVRARTMAAVIDPSIKQ